MKYSTLRQRVWRWHFFAGLMVVPFAVVLALSGAIYLFKPQLESYVESNINARAASSSASKIVPAEQLITPLLTKYPSSKLKSVVLSKVNDRTIEVELDVSGVRKIFWVDQYSAEILSVANKHEQLMNFVKTIHGELLMGSYGSYVVELMASWMIVLVVTGLFLWWPRNTKSNDSFLKVLKRHFFPKLIGVNSREMFKRLHAALGLWLSFMILLLLISGLPWTQVWGSGFKNIQSFLGWSGPGQEWSVTLQSKPLKDDGIDAWTISGNDESRTTLTSNDKYRKSNTSAITLQSIIDNVAPMNLSHPIKVTPPRSANGVWTVRSMTPYRPERVTIHFDKWSGDEIMKVGFDDYHPVKKLTSYGIALHEGALFGWFNQLLGVLTALGVVVLSISGIVMWWKRRPDGKLAAPKATNARLSFGVLAITFGLALFLPTVAISLVVVLILEKAWHITVLVLKPAV